MKLHLLPVPISDLPNQDWVGIEYQQLLAETRLFFVENIRTARRWIASLKLGISIDNLEFIEVNKDTKQSQIQEFVQYLKKEGTAILMSESGCPGVADPGALLVAEVHRLGGFVYPRVGPSSILLALMSSGFSGQQFAFHGYLPIEKKERSKKISQLEAESARFGQTQIFIETPYRNAALWKALLEDLHGETHLCFAQDILGPHQNIQRKKVSDWRKMVDFQWEKYPAVFLFQAR